MKKTNIIIVLVIVAALGYYYSTTKKSVEVTPTPVPAANEEISANPAPEEQATDVTIDIKDMAFSPAAVDIKTGTKVTWTNSDSVAHTIVSDIEGIINSPTIDPGQTYRFTFTKAGTVTYYCGIHPTMRASITVNP